MKSNFLKKISVLNGLKKMPVQFKPNVTAPVIPLSRRAKTYMRLLYVYKATIYYSIVALRWVSLFLTHNFDKELLPEKNGAAILCQ